MSESWTIQELRQRVEHALAGDAAPANGQVRAIPDERGIRYYTTLGLLDRPALRGRTALYGRRHLAQLVTIKRWQAEGRSLATIQRELPTLDDAGLSRASGIALVASPRARARHDFWRTADTAAETETASETEAEPAPETETAAETEIETETASEPAPRLRPVASVLELSLAPGVRLAFENTRPATDADAAALLAAAASLLAELHRRHLISPAPEPITTPERSLEDRP